MRRDAHTAARVEQRDDHVCAGERLAGTWRALNWETRLVKVMHEATGGFEHRFAFAHQLLTKRAPSETRRASEQERARCARRPRALDAVDRDPLGELGDCVLLKPSVEEVVRHKGGRVRNASQDRAALELDPVVAEVEHSARTGLSRRVMRRVADRDLVLLWRELVAEHDRTLLPSTLRDTTEPPDALVVVVGVAVV